MQEFVPSHKGAVFLFTASDALCIHFGQITEAAFTQALSIEQHSACVWSVTPIQRSRKEEMVLIKIALDVSIWCGNR